MITPIEPQLRAGGQRRLIRGFEPATRAPILPAMTAPAEAPAASADGTKRPRLYFGWYIVAGAFFGQMLQAGLSAYAGGVFLVPMTEDLGWTRTEFTLAQTVGQVGDGLDRLLHRRPRRSPWRARRDDRRRRHHRRRRFSPSAYIQEWWQWLVLRGLFFMGGAAMIGSLVVNVTLSKWFVDLRGRAIGIAADRLLDRRDYDRPAAHRLRRRLRLARRLAGTRGGRRAAIIFPIALLFRRQPEDHGLSPDGRNRGGAARRRRISGSRPTIATRTRGARRCVPLPST